MSLNVCWTCSFLLNVCLRRDILDDVLTRRHQTTKSSRSWQRNIRQPRKIYSVVSEYRYISSFADHWLRCFSVQFDSGKKNI